MYRSRQGTHHIDGNSLFQNVSDLLNQLNDQNQSPLYISIEQGNPNIALFLLQRGPTSEVLNAVNSLGYSLLHAAVLSQKTAGLVDLLLQLGNFF